MLSCDLVIYDKRDPSHKEKDVIAIVVLESFSVEEFLISVQFSSQGIELAQGMTLLKYIPNPKMLSFSFKKFTASYFK